jgi:hypothetical protein
MFEAISHSGWPIRLLVVLAPLWLLYRAVSIIRRWEASRRALGQSRGPVSGPATRV